jgi:hypothetical protein
MAGTSPAMTKNRVIFKWLEKSLKMLAAFCGQSLRTRCSHPHGDRYKMAIDDSARAL